VDRIRAGIQGTWSARTTPVRGAVPVGNATPTFPSCD